MTSFVTPETKDRFYNDEMNLTSANREIGLSTSENRFHKLFNGFNHSRSGYADAEKNVEATPMVFFTKPVLNLSYDNLAKVRYLTPLMSNNPDSQACAVKCMLSPNLGHTNVPRDISKLNVRSNHVDDRSPFIPLLTNLTKSVSGWPDRSVDVFKYNENIRKATVAIADSQFDYYSSTNLNVTFRNVAGDPLQLLFTSWLAYMGACAEGIISPYRTFSTDNTIDYCVGIWEIILDSTKTKLTKITRTIGFPVSFPDGAYFNFDKSNNISPDNNEISIPFECVGAEHNEPILPYEFNQYVELCNPLMRDRNREKFMYKIPRNSLAEHNGQGYPRIEDDNTFNWYYYKN